MSPCVTQQNLLILAEDFYVTNSYNILGDQLSKPNWACSACGMYSGRKESVVRHIRNKNVHDGCAFVIPFADSLIARQSGFYVGQYKKKNYLNTGFELFQKALPEKMAEKLAEKLTEKWASAGPQSLAIEPIKVLYTESRAHRPDKLLLCSHLNPLTGFQPDQDYSQYEVDARAKGFVSPFVSPLTRWIDYALSTTKQKKLLHFASLNPIKKMAFP